MFKILDPLYIRTNEKHLNFRFTQDQLEEARANEGHVGVRINGRFYHFRIPMVSLRDLLPSHYDYVEEVSTPW